MLYVHTKICVSNKMCYPLCFRSYMTSRKRLFSAMLCDPTQPNLTYSRGPPVFIVCPKTAPGRFYKPCPDGRRERARVDYKPSETFEFAVNLRDLFRWRLRTAIYTVGCTRFFEAPIRNPRVVTTTWGGVN